MWFELKTFNLVKNTSTIELPHCQIKNIYNWIKIRKKPLKCNQNINIFYAFFKILFNFQL